MPVTVPRLLQETESILIQSESILIHPLLRPSVEASANRMRKKTANDILASLRGSAYSLGKRLFIQAMGGRVKTAYDSPPRSLRPCWTAFLRILRGCSASSPTSISATATEVTMSFSAAS